jgi:hypothetical protein
MDTKGIAQQHIIDLIGEAAWLKFSEGERKLYISLWENGYIHGLNAKGGGK